MMASEAGVSSAPNTPCSAAGEDQQLDRRRERAQQRGDAEPGDADREHAPLAVQVGERAGDEDQRREREQVGVRHPLLAGEPAAEVVGDGRQRDVDGRGVDCHDATTPGWPPRERRAWRPSWRRSHVTERARHLGGRLAFAAMLAYVFWHVAARGDRARGLRGRGSPRSTRRCAPTRRPWLGPTATVGLAAVPWLGGAAGYEDWYLVEDFTALGELNVGGRDRRPAAAPRRRRGGRRARRRRGHGPRRRTAAARPRPAGARGSPSPPAGATTTSTPSWRGCGASAWQRQMVLGPATEYCVLAPAPLTLPWPAAGSGRCGRWSRRPSCSASHATRSASTRPRSGSRSLNSSWKRSS